MVATAYILQVGDTNIVTGGLTLVHGIVGNQSRRGGIKLLFVQTHDFCIAESSSPNRRLIHSSLQVIRGIRVGQTANLQRNGWIIDRSIRRHRREQGAVSEQAQLRSGVNQSKVLPGIQLDRTLGNGKGGSRTVSKPGLKSVAAVMQEIKIGIDIVSQTHDSIKIGKRRTGIGRVDPTRHRE